MTHDEMDTIERIIVWLKRAKTAIADMPEMDDIDDRREQNVDKLAVYKNHNDMALFWLERLFNNSSNV